MIYDAYQSYIEATDPIRALAVNAQGILTSWGQAPFNSPAQRLAAYYELVSLAGFTHTRPAYNIDTLSIEGKQTTVIENVVLATPFGDLLHFKKDTSDPGPKVLLVAPMSGHFATLLRNTVKTLLADHDVYITDWKNARDVSLAAGGFGLDEYTALVIRFLRELGPKSHVVAVCQPQFLF